MAIRINKIVVQIVTITWKSSPFLTESKANLTTQANLFNSSTYSWSANHADLIKNRDWQNYPLTKSNHRDFPPPPNFFFIPENTWQDYIDLLMATFDTWDCLLWPKKLHKIGLIILHCFLSKFLHLSPFSWLTSAYDRWINRLIQFFTSIQCLLTTCLTGLTRYVPKRPGIAHL